jgi:uncharacterized protein (DUF302 family)
MENIKGYANRITTSLPFEDAIEKVTSALQEEGFGILTEIDVKATLKKKLGVDYKPYRILGACNPPFAHEALEAENLIGVLLPCNVVVWDDDCHRVIAAMEPGIMKTMDDNPKIKEVADEISLRLKRVLQKLEE